MEGRIVPADVCAYFAAPLPSRSQQSSLLPRRLVTLQISTVSLQAFEPAYSLGTVVSIPGELNRSSRRLSIPMVQPLGVTTMDLLGMDSDRSEQYLANLGCHYPQPPPQKPSVWIKVVIFMESKWWFLGISHMFLYVISNDGYKNMESWPPHLAFSQHLILGTHHYWKKLLEIGHTNEMPFQDRRWPSSQGGPVLSGNS